MIPVDVPNLGDEQALPAVKAPSLEGLSITLGAQADITAAQLQERFMALARPLATERYRAPREAVKWGDELRVDIMGYTQGRLVPFSVKCGEWLLLAPEPLLPGLYEALVGHGPTEIVAMDVLLPANYPQPALRGVQARFAVRIQAAREVTYPDLTSAEFLRAFGRGATVAEATQSVLEQMVREATQRVFLDARQRVLDEVAARTEVRVPDSLIDEEIRRSWSLSEGVTVQELEFSETQQRESLDTWLQDEATRALAERRLKLALALGAICERDGLTLTPEWVEKLLRQHAEASGSTLEAVAESLRHDPEGQARIDQAAWHLMAVDHVMSRVQVRTSA